MQFLKNYTIRAVMLWVLGLFCLLWGAVGGYSILSLNQLGEGNALDRQLVSQMNTLSQGNDRYFRFITRLARAVDSGRPEDMASAQTALDNMRSLLASFKTQAPGPLGAEQVAPVVESWQQLLDRGVIPQMQLGAQGKSEAFRQHAATVTPALSREFGRRVEQFNAAATARLDDTRAAVDRLTLMTKVVLACALGIGLLILLFTDRYLVQMMVRPLARIRRQFASIASGDLSQPLEEMGRNCVGQLVPLLRNMQESLRDAVGAIRSGTDSIWRGAEEIARGNNDLSSRTGQQAAALEETAASMEQLTAAVKRNAGNARQASQLAEAASATAGRGGVLVGQVVTTMQGIAGSATKIADITSVINSIAFQTNILALNAAVEAARAGEQGRGFAVVASEVRNLAQRSAGAAKEIEGLIGESVSRVESGSSLVAAAGETMDEILRAVEEVTAIMQQIAVASAEQSKGIAQVGTAVAGMDSVTQQNASLVEEVSAAASSLARQTEQLSQSVAKFRLSVSV